MGELILISGGSCSGKTTAALELKKRLGKSAVCISMDRFYKGIGKGQCAEDINFDHPISMDFDKLFEVLEKLISGKAADLPVYDFATHRREERTERVEAAEIIILEGIFALFPSVSGKSKVRFYIDSRIDTMFNRRIERDSSERARDRKEVVHQFLNDVLQMHHDFVESGKKRADRVFEAEKPTDVIVDEMLIAIKELGLKV